MKKLLGDRIRELRSAKNFTQRQVAEQIGVSRQKYARFENENSNLTLEILAKVAGVLDVTVGDITSVLNENSAIVCGADSDNASLKKIFDMLDLFYANKHMYTKLYCDTD